jgi:hypothetical protein
MDYASYDTINNQSEAERLIRVGLNLVVQLSGIDGRASTRYGLKEELIARNLHHHKIAIGVETNFVNVIAWTNIVEPQFPRVAQNE